MSIQWSSIEAAIHAWAVAGTGLAAENVIWGAQEGPRPVGPYVTLQAAVRTIGIDWNTTADAPAPAPEVELEYFAQGVRELTLSVQCFGGSHRGASGPQGLLNSMIAHAHLETRRDALCAAGWVPARTQPVTSIDGVIGGSTFEPRAVFQCSGQVASEITELGTYIQITEVTNLITGVTHTLDTEP